jgi:hypothetical protein
MENYLEKRIDVIEKKVNMHVHEVDFQLIHQIKEIVDEKISNLRIEIEKCKGVNFFKLILFFCRHRTKI